MKKYTQKYINKKRNKKYYAKNRDRLLQIKKEKYKNKNKINLNKNNINNNFATEKTEIK